jgi:Tfp pilus assembly protein PilF
MASQPIGRRGAAWRTLVGVTVLLPAVINLTGCKLVDGVGATSKSVVESRQLCQQGVSSMEREKWSEAEQQLARSVERCGSDPEARRNYARALWHNGSRELAIEQLEEANRLSPDDASLHCQMAMYRIEQGDLPAAQRSVETALELEPGRSDAWIAQARVHQRSGAATQALAAYHRALSTDPGNAEILLSIAELYRQQNQPQRALATLQTVRESYSPGDEPPRLFFLLGLASNALGRSDQAAAEFELARQRGDHSPELLYELAKAQMQAGHFIEANSTVSELVAQNPGHPWGVELSHQLRTARAPGGVPR